MYYHYSIILSFYPPINFDFLDSNVSALEVCTDAANAVTTLARAYESLYGLRRTPCYLPYIIFASGIAHQGGLTHSVQEVAILQVMSLYHGSSKRACRTLLSWAMNPSAIGRGPGDNSDSDGQPPWEPFVRSMTWPATDSRRHNHFH